MFDIIDKFNSKWGDYLEPGHYGLDIMDPEVADYLDKEFKKEIELYPNFSYSQIKLKFGVARVYATSDKCFEWEQKINEILNV